MVSPSHMLDKCPTVEVHSQLQPYSLRCKLFKATVVCIHYTCVSAFPSQYNYQKI